MLGGVRLARREIGAEEPLQSGTRSANHVREELRTMLDPRAAPKAKDEAQVDVLFQPLVACRTARQAAGIPVRQFGDE